MDLATAALLTAQKLGVIDILLEEFEFSQGAALNAMRNTIPFLPADSARWIGEMEEIAATFASAGVSSGFHDGAADIFKILAKRLLIVHLSGGTKARNVHFS